jgi:hypothetical protein
VSARRGLSSALALLKPDFVSEFGARVRNPIFGGVVDDGRKGEAA